MEYATPSARRNSLSVVPHEAALSCNSWNSDFVIILEVAVGATLRCKITTLLQPTKGVLQLVLTPHLYFAELISVLSS